MLPPAAPLWIVFWTSERSLTRTGERNGFPKRHPIWPEGPRPLSSSTGATALGTILCPTHHPCLQTCPQDRKQFPQGSPRTCIPWNVSQKIFFSSNKLGKCSVHGLPSSLCIHEAVEHIKSTENSYNKITLLALLSRVISCVSYHTALSIVFNIICINILWSQHSTKHSLETWAYTNVFSSDKKQPPCMDFLPPPHLIWHLLVLL